MSYIFEALQRAEAERTGGTAPVPAETVADLLQEIERAEQTAAEAKAARPPAASERTLVAHRNARWIEPPTTHPSGHLSRPKSELRTGNRVTGNRVMPPSVRRLCRSQPLFQRLSRRK